MRKILITSCHGGILTAVSEDGRIAELWAESAGGEFRVGDIRLGRVRNVAENLQAAFVELTPEQTAFLRLDRILPLNTDGERRVHAGDSVLVQVEKEPLKTKGPSVSAQLSLAGERTVLMYPGSGISFSRKIADEAWKEGIRARLEDPAPCGVIVRTEAEGAEPEEIARELEGHRQQLGRLLEIYRMRPVHSLLCAGKAVWETVCERWLTDPETEKLVTDRPEVPERLEETGAPGRDKARLYTDEALPMTALYRLETAVSDALARRVWLRSGGYLVIDPTEALTVIDVNSGKNEHGRSKPAAARKLNEEAAREIAAQLRLRNMCGMILVDFIDADAESRADLLRQMRRLLKEDPVYAEAVDITPLGLMEITRRRVRRPFAEQWRALEDSARDGAGDRIVP